MNNLNEAKIFNAKSGQPSSPADISLEDFKKNAENNPTQADELLKVFVEEISRKIKKLAQKPEGRDPRITREYIGVLLKSIETQYLENLTREFSEVKKGNFNDIDFSGSSEGVEFTSRSLGKYFNIDLTFPEIEASAEYAFSVGRGGVVRGEDGHFHHPYTFKNIHRQVSQKLRGYKVGTWLQEMSERAAVRAGITELDFQSKDFYNSVIFAISQGYICETQKDRADTFEVLKYLNNHPEEYYDKERRKVGGIINFKKLLEKK